MNNIYKFVITKYNYRKELDTLSYEIHDSCRMKSFYFRHLIAKYNMYRNATSGTKNPIAILFSPMYPISIGLKAPPATPITI